MASLRAAQKRKQRKIKRALVAVAGWGLMGLMAYLIMTTDPAEQKLWNPYDILGISEVCASLPIPSPFLLLACISRIIKSTNNVCSLPRKTK